MRTAGFTFIYALRRKDGGIMNAEDVGVIKLQTVDTNRRVKTDDDRAVLIGTNIRCSVGKPRGSNRAFCGRELFQTA